MKFVFALLLGSACVLSVAVPSESLACHKEDNMTHGKDPVPCDDTPPPPDDGGTPPTAVPTWGWWVNKATVPNAVWDADPDSDGWPERQCTPESLQVNGNAGSYHCWHVTEKWPYPVTFDFSGVGDYGLSGKRGEAVLCDAFVKGMSIVADGLFNYTWEGNCKDPDGCLIRIINWFNGDQVTTAVAEAIAPEVATPIRRIVLQGLSNIKLGPGEDSNPFFTVEGNSLKPRVILVDTFNINFVRVGTNRTVASCTYDMTTATTPAVFESVPRP